MTTANAETIEIEPQSPSQERNPAPNNEALNAPSLPVVFLPGDITTIRESACSLLGELSKTGSVFNHLGRLVAVNSKPHLPLTLEPLEKRQLPSFAERYVRFHRKEWTENGNAVRVLSRAFTQSHAASILACKEALDVTPTISRLCSFPPLSADGVVLSSGYHPAHELLVTSKIDVPEMSTDEAVAQLLELLGDWKLETPADQSRAIAAMLAPMLRLSLLNRQSFVMPIFRFFAVFSGKRS